MILNSLQEVNAVQKGEENRALADNAPHALEVGLASMMEGRIWQGELQSSQWREGHWHGSRRLFEDAGYAFVR